MAQLIRATALAAAASLASPLVAAATCLHYEPAQVMLVGRLATDRNLLALKLERPICVIAGSGNPAAEGVKLVHFNFQMLGAAPGAGGWQGRRAAAWGSLYRGSHDRDGELSLLVTGFGRTR